MFRNHPTVEIAYVKNGAEVRRNALESSDYRLQLNFSENTVKLGVESKQKMQLLRLKLTFSYQFPLDAKVFLNGYQSWTNCRELTRDDRVVGIKKLAKAIPIARRACEYFGDYTFHSYAGKGIFHGYTYAYLRQNEAVTLLGSMTEDEGFTIITFDLKNNLVILEKDVEGKIAEDKFTAFDVRVYQGDYENVFDRYFAEMGIPKPRLERLNGYTSWYNYFQKIDRNIILNDLKGLASVNPKADIFQIDDGWQTAVGDWLSVDIKKFPSGMKELSDAVHAEQMLSGLWLAPFLTEKKSKIAKEHPDWLLRDKKGKPYIGNIGWSGAYILDFYNAEVRSYLKQVFDTVLNKWGYDMVKLDFLYAVCLHPARGKSRGQIMAEAMKFLRELVGSKLILGCGVPLGSAFGRVDLCRISADVDLSYKERFYSRLSNREIISTRCALENAVYRRHLDGRAFGNDPDVFFLREERLRFSETEKQILAAVNSLLGSVRFVSDNINGYREEQRKILETSFRAQKAKLISADLKQNNKILTIVYNENGNRKTLEIPLK